MFRQFISGSIVAGVLATGAASAADDSGFYVGLGLGQAHNETGQFRDLEDSVAKAFAGYSFNDCFAAEVARICDNSLPTVAVPIRVPALRERVEDIALLARFFTAQLCAKNNVRERNHILKVLQKNSGNVSQAAIELGIRRTYLHRRMSQLGIDKKAIYGSGT